MLKILVIDDSDTTLQHVTETLSSKECEIETAKTIWVAPLVNKFNPDLILMDVNISSGSKGTTAVAALKKFQNNCIILLHSSLSPKELRVLACECGADGYICKSSDPEKLIQQIEDFLKKS